jgi:outer membrane protein assembly factor BamB
MDRQKTPKEVERVLCLDATSGKVVWEHAYEVSYRKLDYGNGPRCTPTVHGGKVYTFGATGHLYCLDAKTGKVAWHADTVKRFDGKVPQWGHACSPLVDEGRLVVQVGGSKALLVAFDLQTGKEIWRALDGPAGYSSPVVIGKELVFFTPKSVVGLGRKDGAVKWKVPFEGIQYDVAISDPVLADGVVLASNYWSGSKAIRLGPKPTVAWEGKRLSLLMCTPLVQGKHVYALDRAKGLMCIELSSGKVLWEKEHVTPRDRNPHASMAWVGSAESGKALILNTPGELQLVKLSPEKIEYLGKTKLIGKTWAHLGLGDGCVFARDDKEIVCAPLREK